ncbi:MAG: hypothetical protein JWO36_3878 [Myxococcales bacterium]|nr:hypothetical protein [Myxococcales bacterium]
MIARAICEEAFREAVIACDPAVRVRDALGKLADRLAGRERIGIAIGKAAFAMARGAGPVARGVAVSNADDGRELPEGWTKLVASHPVPDERSLEAGDAVIDLVASARPEDEILALISGGASALVERLAPGVTLEQQHAQIGAVMASGAKIGEINRARIALSAIKGGKLAAMSEAPITTLAISDVFDNDLAVIGSGPTIAGEGQPWRPGDYARVIAPIETFARAVCQALFRVGVARRYFGNLDREIEPTGPVDDVATTAAALFDANVATFWGQRAVGRPAVAWGEPTLALPKHHGEGGRAQQLALELAKRMRGTWDSAFIAGSDGIDGPPPHGRPAPAGAYVDGSTWDAIVAAGIDPDRALARCDAGPALEAVGALVITGPTGINFADVMIIG